MRNWFTSAVAIAAFMSGLPASAGELSIQVLLQGQVAPGVYGQVQIGPAAPPPLVFAQPLVIVQQSVPLEPVYLHVPPGHARNWRKHCREYNACNRPVYFVRSAEYEPDYDRRRYEREHEHEHEHDRDHGGDEHDRGRGHDHDHERHDDN